jgi:hypothetical protein
MAANLLPISSDGGFTSGGNININSGSSIVTAIDEDLNIIVQDEEDDGWSLQLKVTDGSNVHSIIDQQRDNIQIGVGITTGPAYYWDFDDQGRLNLPEGGNIQGAYGNNSSYYAIDNGSGGAVEMKVLSYIGDSLIANVRVSNPNVTISTSGGTNTWTFDNTGNLTLPSNTFAVNYANGDQVSFGAAALGNVTFDDVTIQGVNQLNLSWDPLATANLSYLQVRGGDVASHIHLDTGNNEAYDLIVGDDSKFVQVSSTGDIIMSSYDGNTSYTWTLDTTGNLILAGGESVIQSVANSSLDPINPNVSTMILTPSVGYSSQSLVLDPTAPGHIHLRAPSANIDEPLANIFLGGETSSFEVGYHNGNAPNVFIHSGGNTWTFDNGGNLVFPRDAAGNTDPILTIKGGANPKILSEDVSLAGPANLEIAALNTIFTGSSGDEIRIYPDDGEIGSTANLQIWTNAASNTQYSWTFDDTGNLTVPGNTTVSTAESTGGAAGNSISIIAGAADQSDYYTTAGGNVNISGGLGAGNDGGGGGPGGSVNISAGLSADPVGVAGNVVINTGGTSYTFNELSLNVSTNPPASPAPILNGFGVISAPEFTNGNSSVTINANSSIWTFSSAGDLTLPGNISGNTNGYTIGYLNIPQVSASNTTLALTDAGKHYYSTTAGNLTLTIPTNANVAFATGTAISIVVQAAGNILVNASAGVTLYVAGNSTAANRVVGGYGMATLMKVASDTWFINGTGVS